MAIWSDAGLGYTSNTSDREELVRPVTKLSSTVDVVVQLFVSVIVAVYWPAARPLATDVPCPADGAGDQEYVYAGVPPDARAVMLPSEHAPQLGLVSVVPSTRGVGQVIGKVLAVWHPFYVYGVFPPDKVAVAVPLVPLLQRGFVEEGVIAEAA
jgi:hypothetical protein